METPRRTAILPGAFRLFSAFSAVFALALLPAACSDSDGSPTGGGSLSSGSGDSAPGLSSGDGGSSPSGSDAGGRSRPGEGGSSGSVPGGTSSGTLSSGEGTTSSSGAVATADWRDTCLAIVNEYRGDVSLFHFDMYRLGSADELFDIGWEDYLSREGVCAVEWSENVPGAFDGSEIRVTIEKMDETARRITVEGLELC